eukprot:scaffold19923_cov107-Isochrysis_galbana.AAC.10
MTCTAFLSSLVMSMRMRQATMVVAAAIMPKRDSAKATASEPLSTHGMSATTSTTAAKKSPRAGPETLGPSADSF